MFLLTVQGPLPSHYSSLKIIQENEYCSMDLPSTETFSMESFFFDSNVDDTTTRGADNQIFLEIAR